MTAPASGRNRSRPAATCRRCNFRIIACSGIRTARRRSVKNGAGLLANPPRFLPLLAGPSFHGSGIGPESFAASGNVQEAQPPHSRLWRNKDNRGLRPRGTLYFLTAKSTKNSPADAFAYFVPSNVRNGRLFAGLQANRPRFLPLLAGPSFLGFGIGPGSFAAKRGGRDAFGTSRKHRSLRSPLEAVLNRRILACSGERTTDSPRARSGRLHSLVLAAPAQRGPEVVPAKATCGWFWCF